ncbi:MAG: hypothetical protein AAFV29_11765, partial [Myxococcota bacterium]
SADGFAERSTAHRLLNGFLLYRADEHARADDLLEGVVADEGFVDRYPTALYYAGRTRIFYGAYREGLDFLDRFEKASRRMVVYDSTR